MIIFTGITFFALDVVLILGLVWLERVLSIPHYAWLGPENCYVIVALVLIITMLLLIPFSRRHYPQTRRRSQQSRLTRIVTIATCLYLVGEALWLCLRPNPMSVRIPAGVTFLGATLMMYGEIRGRLARGR